MDRASHSLEEMLLSISGGGFPAIATELRQRFDTLEAERDRLERFHTEDAVAKDELTQERDAARREADALMPIVRAARAVYDFAPFDPAASGPPAGYWAAINALGDAVYRQAKTEMGLRPTDAEKGGA